MALEGHIPAEGPENRLSQRLRRPGGLCRPL